MTSAMDTVITTAMTMVNIPVPSLTRLFLFYQRRRGTLAPQFEQLVKFDRQQQHTQHARPSSPSQVESPVRSSHIINHPRAINMNHLPFPLSFLKQPVMDRTFAVKQLLFGGTPQPLLFDVAPPRGLPLDRDRHKKQMDRHLPPPFRNKKPQKENASAALPSKKPQKARLLSFCGPMAVVRGHGASFPVSGRSNSL